MSDEREDGWACARRIARLAESPNPAVLLREVANAERRWQDGETTKQSLLDHYATKMPTRFYQIDCWQVGSGDDVMEPDDDGHCLTGGPTVELMDGADPTGVRVLVGRKCDRQQGAALLRKAAAWVEAGACDPDPELEQVAESIVDDPAVF